MSVYYHYDYFVSCTKEEAIQITKKIDAIDASFKGEADYSYSCTEYDAIRKGIYVYECKRNSARSELRYLFYRYKTFYMYCNDTDCEYYTNDISHNFFPKYIIEGEEMFSDKELTLYLKELFSQNLAKKDNPFYNLNAPNPNVDFDGFLNWCEENDYLADFDFSVVHTIK